jgi:hypothetical protein
LLYLIIKINDIITDHCVHCLLLLLLSIIMAHNTAKITLRNGGPKSTKYTFNNNDDNTLIEESNNHHIDPESNLEMDEINVSVGSEEVTSERIEFVNTPHNILIIEGKMTTRKDCNMYKVMGIRVIGLITVILNCIAIGTIVISRGTLDDSLKDSDMKINNKALDFLLPFSIISLIIGFYMLTYGCLDMFLSMYGIANYKWIGEVLMIAFADIVVVIILAGADCIGCVTVFSVLALVVTVLFVFFKIRSQISYPVALAKALAHRGKEKILEYWTLHIVSMSGVPSLFGRRRKNSYNTVKFDPNTIEISSNTIIDDDEEDYVVTIIPNEDKKAMIKTELDKKTKEDEERRIAELMDAASMNAIIDLYRQDEIRKSIEKIEVDDMNNNNNNNNTNGKSHSYYNYDTEEMRMAIDNANKSSFSIDDNDE